MSASRDQWEDYLWLVSAEGKSWLEKIAGDPRPLHQLLASLRKDLCASRARLVVEQIGLRRRASEKFPWASVMFFIPLGLEQATDAWVGCYKAQRYPADQLAADLCCGIGGDLLALAFRGPVEGVDKSALAVLFAHANVEAVAGQLGLSPQAKTLADDVSSWSAKGRVFPPWHMDPDRRREGVRTAQPIWSSPPPQIVDTLLARQKTAAIKLAPAAELPLPWQKEAEREWISFGGRCRQQVAWFGSVAKDPGRHAATVVLKVADPRFPQAERVVGTPDLPVPIASKIGSYLLDPAPSVLAARLLGEISRRFALEALSTHGGYLTADHLPGTKLVDAYRVEEVLPFDLKRLRAWARAHGKGEAIIKKRSLPVDVDKWRTLLRGPGEVPFHLVLAEHAGKRRAIAVCPVEVSVSAGESSDLSGTG